MKIVWDERKRLANIDKHDIDFADLDLSFFASAQIGAGKHGRFKAVGDLAGSTITVIFARLGQEGLSIVSARIADVRERRGFHETKTRN